MPSKPKGGAKKAGMGAAKKKEPIRPAGPGAIAAGGGLGGISLDDEKKSGKNTPEEAAEVHLAATGIDSMLEALELVNARTDKEALGAKVSTRTLFPFSLPCSHLTRVGWFDRETPRATFQGSVRSLS